MRKLRGSSLAAKSGVSLLTILISLALMAVVAGFAIPAFFNRHGVTLDNAALLLARDVRVAQNHAILSGRACSFHFLEEGRGWRVLADDGSLLARPDQQGMFERDFRMDGVFEGVQLKSVDFDGEQELRFDKSGRALPGGTLQVTFKDQVRFVRVFALSGRVTIDGLTRASYDPDH